MIRAIGDIVRVRSRQYLVEGVDLPLRPGDSTLVRLSCLEDDAQGTRSRCSGSAKSTKAKTKSTTPPKEGSLALFNRDEDDDP